MSILYIRDKNGNFVQMPSVPGKSAYEIAVAKGTFSGTEQEFAEMQVINNKDIIDQITQENIDNWNSAKGMTDEEKEQLANKIDKVELTDDEQLIFYSEDKEISRIQLQGGMSDEEKEQLNTKLATKFDDVALNENETNDMQTALDFYSEGKVVKTAYFTGGSGGGSSTSAYISTELEENVMVGTDENFNLTIDFVSPNPGKGTLKVFINDVEAVSKSIGQGESTTIIEGAKFTKGTNRVTVYVIDRVGVMSNSLTFYIRYGSTEISSDFDQYSAYDYGATVRYYFAPTALDTSLTLTFYMSIDGQVQQGVSCTSDTRGYYTFPTNLSADNHYCEAYIIDSNGMKSNVLAFNLIILNTNTLVVASDTKDKTIEEGEQLSLDYKAYMKNNTSFITKTYIDNNLVNTGTCNADFNYYRTSSLTEGIHTIKLEVWDVTETYHDYVTWTITVTPSTYEMLQPVNAGAMFIGTAVNKTNTDERKQYFIGQDQEGNEVLGTLTNFSYNNESGWVNDELIISGNSHVEIPIQPLANNARYGFTLDIEFTSKQIGVPDAEVLTLWNNETNCGIKITTEKLILQSSNGNKCDLYFTDNERTHVMFIIDRQELKAKIYLNGVMCEAFHLNDYTVDGVAYLDDFTVNSNIVLGGLNKNGYCKIRNLRVYQVALTTDEIINNFISCEIDKGKQRELVEFQKGNDLPTLYVYCDFSGLGKDDKKPCKIVYNSTNVEKYGESFTLNHKQSQLQYQGTSSMAYPIKNYRLNLRDENGKKWYYNFPGGQGECRFTLKADFMSSGHWTNTGMAKFINDNLYNYDSNNEKSMNPFRWYHVQNGDDVSNYRETINGFPCRLILINDGSTPLNEGQNEPTPGNTKDMGIFNFNNDKDNVTTLGFDSDIFPNCASYEVTANSDTSAGAFMSFEKSYSIRCTTIATNSYITSDKLDISILMNITPLPWIISNNNKNMYLRTSTGKNIYPNEAITTDLLNGASNVQFIVNDSTVEGIASFSLNDKKFVIDRDSSSLELEPLLVIGSDKDELAYLKESFELRHPDADDVAEDWGFMGIPGEEGTGLKALIDWVDNCTDEEFVADFEEHFHKDYTLRYFCLVTLIGAVDNLGKNMMLDTADNKIYFPRFYDIDTICSYDNSGQLKFNVDIEMEQGYWNTSSSRLWTRIRDLMHDDIVTTYNNMRQNGVSYENMMYYIYDEQIAKIPQAYYNKDYDIKYAPFADSYIGMAHGDTYEHVKRWLKQRFTFVDSLFDYAPSYNNDVLTIRANTTELMTLEIETYTPVYQHLSWYNGQMDKKKIDGKVSVEFSGTAQAATDQEVLIYGGSNVKSIKGITSMNPNRMLIGSATKLVEIDAHDCPLLADINANKANLSPHEYLNKVNLSNCPLLEGNLRLNNSPLIQEINIKGTKITGMNLPSSLRNIEKLQLSDNITSLSLNDAVSLKELSLPSSLESFILRNAVNLQSVGVESLETLHTLYIENPKFNPFSIINNAPNLEYINLTNINCAADSSKMRALGKLKGINLEGEEIPISEAITGKVTLGTCTTGAETYLKSTFPNVEFTIINYIPGFTVKFYDGDNNLIYTTEVESGGEAVYEGLTPTKTSTAQYDYVFTGWNAPLSPITANCIIRAEFESVTRSYKVTFRYPSLEIIEEQTCIYGSMPVPPETTLQYDGWEPALARVYGEQIYTAKSVEMPEDMSLFTFEEVTIGDVTGYECTFNYSSSTCPSHLVFPIVYNDIKVISIASSSSSWKSQISSVYIPKTIMRFGKYAFAGMEKLYKIDQEAISRVVELGDYCFFNLSGSSTTFNFSDKITSFSSNCFYGCKATVYIPSHIHELPLSCFAQSSATIYGIEHITRFGEKALYNFKGTIKNPEAFDPTKVESMGVMAFYNNNYRHIMTDNLFKGEITFSNLTNLESNALGYNTAMTDISFPKLTSVCGDFMSVYSVSELPKLRRITFGSSEYPVEHITSSGFIYNSTSSTGGAYKPLLINVITSDGTSTSLGTNNLYSLSSSSYAITYSLSQANLVFSDSPVDFYFDDNNIGYIVFDDHAECSGQLAGTSGIGELILPQYINGVPLTTIRDYAFCYNAGLTSVKAPHITTLSRCYTFTSCSALTEMEFDSVSKLNMYSPLSTKYSMPFNNCTALVYARFGSQNTPFEIYANSTSYSMFADCSSLVMINLVTLNGVASDVTFTGTSSTYEKLIVYSISPMTYETYYDSSHQSTYMIINGEAKLTKINTLVTSWAAPTDVDWVVTDLGAGFSGCSRLTTVTIPETVTTLPLGCFYGCTSLTDINDLSHITLVKGRAFNGASKLTYVKIGGTIFADSSGYGNFEGCTALEEVWLSGSVGALGGTYLFSGCTNLATITLGSVGNPITSISMPSDSILKSTITTINIYVEDPDNPPTFSRIPGEATNATITYLQA